MDCMAQDVQMVARLSQVLSTCAVFGVGIHPIRLTISDLPQKKPAFPPKKFIHTNLLGFWTLLHWMLLTNSTLSLIVWKFANLCRWVFRGYSIPKRGCCIGVREGLACDIRRGSSAAKWCDSATRKSWPPIRKRMIMCWFNCWCGSLLVFFGCLSIHCASC